MEVVSAHLGGTRGHARIKSLIRPATPEPSALWVDYSSCKVTATVTIIPFTSDLILKKFADFIHKGQTIFPLNNFLKLIGDFTNQHGAWEN